MDINFFLKLYLNFIKITFNNIFNILSFFTFYYDVFLLEYNEGIDLLV